MNDHNILHLMNGHNITVLHDMNDLKLLCNITSGHTQEARAKARAEKLAALRAGKVVGPKKSAEAKKWAKTFYGQVRSPMCVLLSVALPAMPYFVWYVWASMD